MIIGATFGTGLWILFTAFIFLLCFGLLYALAFIDAKETEASSVFIVSVAIAILIFCWIVVSASIFPDSEIEKCKQKHNVNYCKWDDPRPLTPEEIQKLNEKQNR